MRSRSKITIAALLVVLAPLCGFLFRERVYGTIERVGDLMNESGLTAWLIDDFDGIPVQRFLVFLCAGIACLMSIPFLVVRRRRRRFLLGKQPVSDDDFLAHISLPAANAAMGIALRHAVAEQMRVPPALLHPEDTINALSQLAISGVNLNMIRLRIERMTGAGVPWDVMYVRPYERAPSQDPPKTIAEFVRLVAPVIDAHLAEHQA